MHNIVVKKNQNNYSHSFRNLYNEMSHRYNWIRISAIGSIFQAKPYFHKNIR